MKMLLITVLAVSALAALPVADAQEPEDPDCEADPGQLGCDPECADPSVSCHHPPCPTGLAGQAVPGVQQNFMSWTLNSLDDVKVYRAVGDGEFVFTDRLEFPATKHIDHDLVPGTTYRYQVTAINETGVESPACGVFEVTAIPDFPTPLALVGAAALGTIAYAGFRRR